MHDLAVRAEVRRVTILTQYVDRHPIRAATLATWLSQGVSAGSMIILAPLLIGSLGPGAAGTWFFIVAMVAFFQLSDFGVGQSVARQIAYSRDDAGGRPQAGAVFLEIHGRAVCAEIFAGAQRLFRAIAAGIVVLAIAVERTILFAGEMAAGAEQRVTWYLAVFAALGFFLARPYQAYLEGLLQQARERVASALVTLVSNAALILTAFAAPRLPLLGLVLALGGAAQLAVMHALTRRVASRSGPFSVPPRKGLVPALWRASWSQGVTTLGVLGMLSTSSMMVGWLRGAVDVSAYHLPWRVANMAQLALVAMVLPHIAFLIDSARRGEHTRVIERIGRLLARVGLATVMVFGLLVIAGPPLFRLWLGDQLVITRDFLLLLSLWNAFAVLQTVLWAYVIAYGIQRFTVATIAGAVANLLLSFVLIPRFGLVGAAAATLIAQLTTSNWWTLRLAIGVARSHPGTAGVGKVSTTPALALE